MEIEIKDKRKELLEVIHKKIKEGGNIYIYGASTTAQMIRDYLADKGIETESSFVVDDRYYKEGDSSSIPLSRFHDIAKPHDALICGFASYKRYCELAGDEKKLGKTDFFFFPFPYSMNTERCYIDGAFFQDYRSGFERTYGHLEDEESKDLMRVFLEAQICGELDRLQAKHSKLQYFDIPMPQEFDIFIDGGGYIGDTMEAAFANLNRISEYYMFEPDPEHQIKIQKAIDNVSSGKVYWIKKGLWKEETVLHFSSEDSASRLDDSGDIEVEVTSVDISVKTKRGQTVYLKLDIEGSEVPALIGATEMIRFNRPYMAICVYHKRDDLIIIPDLIDEISEEGYKYYLRYYGDNFRELVLYCIPKEKC